ncbi:MAG: type II toxin-antitoxin system MqsA family antitoxin [Anaerolineales bacterium]|nr:type II toxin-antitoxin system MqsA family antitoxin [Anaerolineales bacterium]
MNCLICRQADIVDGFTSIPFERDEFKLVIKHVPAQICPNCGDAIVDENVAIRLLSDAEDASDQGIFEGIRDFGN